MSKTGRAMWTALYYLFSMEIGVTVVAFYVYCAAGTPVEANPWTGVGVGAIVTFLWIGARLSLRLTKGSAIRTNWPGWVTILWRVGWVVCWVVLLALAGNRT